MWLKACLNGSRLVESHPALPGTPEELARKGRKSVDFGAVALLLHPRAPDGKETLDSTAMAAVLLAVRDVCPDIPMEVSTAAWIEKDAARRLGLVRLT